MTETSKARDLSWDCTAAMQGGKQQHQHQHQQAKQQSASSPHSSRGSCLIFLGPQHQILQHRHRGHVVAGPLPCMPGLLVAVPRAAAASTPRHPCATPTHGTGTPKAVGDAAKDHDGSRCLGSPEARVLQYDLPVSSPCVFLRVDSAQYLSGLLLQRTALYLAVVRWVGAIFRSRSPAS